MLELLEPQARTPRVPPHGGVVMAVAVDRPRPARTAPAHPEAAAIVAEVMPARISSVHSVS
ncbi:MAG TPA: hypothetical protein GX000_04225 [Actinomyces sp.]|nr:hypothetical protein [Actinomyces sp.]